MAKQEAHMVKLSANSGIEQEMQRELFQGRVGLSLKNFHFRKLLRRKREMRLSEDMVLWQSLGGGGSIQSMPSVLQFYHLQTKKNLFFWFWVLFFFVGFGWRRALLMQTALKSGWSWWSSWRRRACGSLRSEWEQPTSSLRSASAHRRRRRSRSGTPCS